MECNISEGGSTQERARKWRLDFWGSGAVEWREMGRLAGGWERGAGRPTTDKIVRDVTRPVWMDVQSSACDAGQEEYKVASARPQLTLSCRRVLEASSCHQAGSQSSSSTARDIRRHPAPLPTASPAALSPATAFCLQAPPSTTTPSQASAEHIMESWTVQPAQCTVHSAMRLPSASCRCRGRPMHRTCSVPVV